MTDEPHQAQEELLRAVRESDCSLLLAAVMRVEDPEGYLNRDARRHFDHERSKWDGESFVASSGHYATALYRGDLASAFAHADYSNMALLATAFGRPYLIEAAVSDLGWSEEGTRTLVERAVGQSHSE